MLLLEGWTPFLDASSMWKYAWGPQPEHHSKRTKTSKENHQRRSFMFGVSPDYPMMVEWRTKTSKRNIDSWESWVSLMVGDSLFYPRTKPRSLIVLPTPTLPQTLVLLRRSVHQITGYACPITLCHSGVTYDRTPTHICFNSRWHPDLTLAACLNTILIGML